MNWTEAVQAMRDGASVVRTSQKEEKLEGYLGGIPIIYVGREPMRLAAAWSDDNKPVMVFQGAGSKCLFVPDDEDFSAQDWEVSPFC